MWEISRDNENVNENKNLEAGGMAAGDTGAAGNISSQEEIPAIICTKKQDYAHFSSRYNFPVNMYAQPDGGAQVYRWTLEDEERRVKPAKAKKARRNIGLKIFAAAMCVMFAFSAVMSAVLLGDFVSGAPAADNPGGSFEPLAIIVPQADSEAQDLTVTEVISRIKPSVVTIEAEIEEIGMGFWGRRDPSVRTGVGTGFILSADGYIATNYHVIERATSLTVLLDDGRRYPAEIIGGDEVADLAIIQISARNLSVAELGNSDYTQEGEFVVAIGSPGGVEFAGSSTFGIISGVGREIEVSRGRRMTLLQTDAAINPGNSGGPLVNMRGQVIGINTLKLASNIFAGTLYEGMGFAIPITLAADRFNDILANPGDFTGTARRYSPYDQSEVSFGIGGSTVSAQWAELVGVPRGVLIGSITPDGTVGRTGVEVGDIIIALDGERVQTFEELVELKHDYSPGDEAVLRVYRDGRELDFTIRFDARTS